MSPIMDEVLWVSPSIEAQALITVYVRRSRSLHALQVIAPCAAAAQGRGGPGLFCRRIKGGSLRCHFLYLLSWHSYQLILPPFSVFGYCSNIYLYLNHPVSIHTQR